MYNPFASKPNPAVDQLVAMGFDRVASASALASSDNNVEAALQHLLDHPPPPAATAAPTPATHPTVVDMTGDMTEDAELAAAIALSKQTAAKPTPFQQTKPPPRPASNNKAATAALARSNGTAPSSSSSASPMTQLKKNHPSVKLPPSLESKPWHTQILRTSARIAPSSLAVDTLHRTLTTIQSNPTDPKFRRIDLSTPGFKRSLNNVPGALDFLSLGLGFQQTQGTVYTLPFVDAARMYACVGVLDEIKIRSFEYTVDRMERVFMKTLGNWRGTTGSEEGDCELSKGRMRAARANAPQTCSERPATSEEGAARNVRFITMRSGSPCSDSAAGSERPVQNDRFRTTGSERPACLARNLR